MGSGMGGGAGGPRGPLTMGWLAAFGTSGYEDEPPLMEELGINFQHIKMKVSVSDSKSSDVKSSAMRSYGGLEVVWFRLEGAIDF